jgi:hypothetical protein
LRIAGALARRVGTAFQNVGDTDVRSVQTDGLDDLGEQLAGLADERLALRVFIRPGASPTNMSCASMLPTPNTTFLRDDARNLGCQKQSGC